MFERNKKESAQSCSAFVQEAQKKIRVIQVKLQRLLDADVEDKQVRSIEDQIADSFKKRGWGGARKYKNEKIFLFCCFCLRKSAEAVVSSLFVVDEDGKS